MPERPPEKCAQTAPERNLNMEFESIIYLIGALTFAVSIAAGTFALVDFVERPRRSRRMNQAGNRV